MKVAAILLVVAAAAAADSTYKPTYYPKPSYGYGKDYDYAPARYSFDYQVKDDPSYVNMGHGEVRDGDYTKGSYYVDLPDGRRQVVNYKVDGYSGYVADVNYEGVAKYPSYNSKAPYPAYPSTYEPAYPSYKPAYPSYKPAYPSYKSAYPSYKPAY